jgi:hypothetical protein
LGVYDPVPIAVFLTTLDLLWFLGGVGGLMFSV